MNGEFIDKHYADTRSIPPKYEDDTSASRGCYYIDSSFLYIGNLKTA